MILSKINYLIYSTQIEEAIPPMVYDRPEVIVRSPPDQNQFNQPIVIPSPIRFKICKTECNSRSDANGENIL